jgi:hypothetical protein
MAVLSVGIVGMMPMQDGGRDHDRNKCDRSFAPCIIIDCSGGGNCLIPDLGSLIPGLPKLPLIGGEA